MCGGSSASTHSYSDGTLLHFRQCQRQPISSIGANGPSVVGLSLGVLHPTMTNAMKMALVIGKGTRRRTRVRHSCKSHPVRRTVGMCWKVDPAAHTVSCTGSARVHLLDRLASAGKAHKVPGSRHAPWLNLHTDYQVLLQASLVQRRLVRRQFLHSCHQHFAVPALHQRMVHKPLLQATPQLSTSA